MSSEVIVPKIEEFVSSPAFVVPTNTTKVYKDECTFCFKTPQSTDGLYISLKNYHCFCREHVGTYSDLNGDYVFVQFKSRKNVVDSSSSPRATGEPTNKITKLSIDSPKIEFEDNFFVVVYPELDSPIDSNSITIEPISNAIRIISSTTSAERLAVLSTTNNAWDADVKLITKHSNLEQHNNNKILPSSGWKCETEGCGLTENLWLCLTDGSIRCGRSQFVSDGQKSAGNGHMQEYYNQTKYPLVVKLGTICAQLDAADVYSYDEDDAVVDPNLDKHLAHFGLDPSKLEKTVKSTMEMELDMNEKWEWARCQEDGATLEPIYGAGYTGIINIGSSCYMNSVLQSLVQIENFRRRYVDGAWDIFTSQKVDEIHTNFNAQFAKVLSSMMSGKFADSENIDGNGIKPLQFKRVTAGNHPEFSTAKQQDVEEYIRFLFEKVSENTAAGTPDPTKAVRFQTWNRFEDIASKKVRYTEQEEVIMHLPIPQNLLQPIEGSENRFKVNMGSTLEAYFGAQIVEGYKSPITGEVKGASNTLRFKTFPDYLFVQVQKFAYSNEGQMKKLDVDFEIEENLDLSFFKGNGKGENEELLPEDAKVAVAPPKIPDNIRSVADQLKGMGFSENAALKAAFEAKGSVEIATDWLMIHLEDPSLNDEYVVPSESAAPAPQDSEINTFLELGFNKHQATYALSQKPNVHEAIDWLFNNIDNVPAESSLPTPSSKSTNKTTTPREYVDGEGKYELIGMISHMGSRPDSGHYVAHMLKNGKWVLFNDEKVALSQDPPKQLAYVYLYKRA